MSAQNGAVAPQLPQQQQRAQAVSYIRSLNTHPHEGIAYPYEFANGSRHYFCPCPEQCSSQPLPFRSTGNRLADVDRHWWTSCAGNVGRTKAFHCQRCGKGFAQPAHKKNHERKCGDQRLALFKCRLCQQSWCDATQLRRHVQGLKCAQLAQQYDKAGVMAVWSNPTQRKALLTEGSERDDPSPSNTDANSSRKRRRSATDVGEQPGNGTNPGELSQDDINALASFGAGDLPQPPRGYQMAQTINPSALQAPMSQSAINTISNEPADGSFSAQPFSGPDMTQNDNSPAPLVNMSQGFNNYLSNEPVEDNFAAQPSEGHQMPQTVNPLDLDVRTSQRIANNYGEDAADAQPVLQPLTGQKMTQNLDNFAPAAQFSGLQQQQPSAPAADGMFNDSSDPLDVQTWNFSNDVLFGDAAGDDVDWNQFTDSNWEGFELQQSV